MTSRTNWAAISRELQMFDRRTTGATEQEKALADAFHQVTNCKEPALRGRNCKTCAVKSLRLKLATK
jgi:hypothetical protein